MTNKGYKILSFIFLCCFVFFLAGCSKDIGSMNVYLGGKVVEKEDKIIIEGKSNLIEGARVIGELYVNRDELFTDYTDLVDDQGNFKMELEHHQYGDAEIVVKFDMKESVQDEAIIEHYGENGSKIEGPYVYLTEHSKADEIAKKAEIRLPIEANDEKTTYTFSESKWDDPPKDYGEPNVWIEVDELTDDGEFTYVKGRTNLLEGSLISAEHLFKEDTTRVQPDGSFSFQLEYQYRENEPIIIEFSPRDQWGSIEQHYGENGEKLVGNLVEKYGNLLYLSASFDYQ